MSILHSHNLPFTEDIQLSAFHSHSKRRNTLLSPKATVKDVLRKGLERRLCSDSSWPCKTGYIGSNTYTSWHDKLLSAPYIYAETDSNWVIKKLYLSKIISNLIIQESLLLWVMRCEAFSTTDERAVMSRLSYKKHKFCF